ncbi:MAG TPA: glycosyltransferase family 39 protein [Chloroflexota bacterium]|nr:glycosyltransferase family 39 protein [Chloroflexota bacterium]
MNRPSSWLRRHSDISNIVFVALLSLAVRVAFTGRAPAFLIGDSENYFLPGFQLAHGLGFDLELRRTPLYPLFLAGSMLLAGEDLQGIVTLQHTLGVLTCILTYLLGLLTFGRWVGLIAATLTAISGSAIIGEHTIMTEVLFTPILLAHLILLVLAVRRHSLRLAAFAGILLGLAALARPVGLTWVAALPFALALATRSFGQTVRMSGVTVLGLALVTLPWMARNYFAHESFSADGSAGQTLVGRTLRHDSGFTFYDPSWPPDPDPGQERTRKIMQEWVGRATFLTPVRRRVQQELNVSEAEASRLMQREAINALTRQPGYYVRGTLAGFGRLMLGVPERPRDAWASRREARNREEWEALPEIRHLLGPPTAIQDREQRSAEAIVSVFQPARWGTLLLTGFVLGMAAVINRPGMRAGSIPLLCVLAAIGAAVALVAPLPRYRWPVEPLYAIVAVGGFAWAGQIAFGLLGGKRPRSLDGQTKALAEGAH